MCYANTHCERIWHMLNRYVANLILQKYARRADTEYLHLSNKAILSAVKKIKYL